MMTINELTSLLQRLISLPKENEYVEFKDSNKDPDEIGKRISALANGAALVGQQYGYLVFGVEDASHLVIGTSFKPTETKKGNEELEFWLGRMLSPSIDFRIYEFQYQNKNIALFHIPAANGQPILFQNDAYIRVGSYLKFLREFPEKARKLWQKSSTEYELEYAKQGVSAADVVALLDTQAIFDMLLKIPYPTTQQGVIDKLIDEKLIVRSNGHYHITNLGALLFAKDLKKFDLERKAVRVIKYKGTGKTNTEKDTFFEYGYGSCFERINKHISDLLPSNEIIEFVVRKEVHLYPLLAIRELLANAVIHQNFRETGTYLTVEIYKGRIEISNAGLPTVEINRFIDGYNSRNNLLANAMRRMNLCEAKGSGIDKVIEQCELYQLPAPYFIGKLNQTIATIFAPRQFEEMDKQDKIRACYQHCCLLYVNSKKMTNQTLRERFKISEENAKLTTKIIKDTLTENLIKLENPDSKSRKFVSYVPYWA
jgi:predicted HTH transcriptional regulator